MTVAADAGVGTDEPTTRGRRACFRVRPETTSTPRLPAPGGTHHRPGSFFLECTPAGQRSGAPGSAILIAGRRDDGGLGWQSAGRPRGLRADWRPMAEHSVKKGDHVPRLAHREGHRAIEQVWDHPDNSELRKEREDPCILLPRRQTHRARDRAGHRIRLHRCEAPIRRGSHAPHAGSEARKLGWPGARAREVAHQSRWLGG